jgi:signal transduction histidine kinase
LTEGLSVVDSRVYGKFIDVWRQKETALAANQLTNLLLANASHEGSSRFPSFFPLLSLLTTPGELVRTPLNAIVNYLELALEGKVDDDVRENLTRSHAASRTLIHVINDLLVSLPLYSFCWSRWLICQFSGPHSS